jgi:hypothetical protein
MARLRSKASQARNGDGHGDAEPIAGHDAANGERSGGKVARLGSAS